MKYIIKFLGKRYNSKSFDSYEAARKYVRRLITKLIGQYKDSYSTLGFQIVTK